MSYSLKSLMLASCLFSIFFMSADLSQLTASQGRWGVYDNERGAWGGNGGSWAGGRNDWHGDYGTPEEYYGGDYYSNPYYNNPGNNYNGYYYNNDYPYGMGVGAGADVNGAGLYFNVR
jgi:hypothetical protein